VLHAQPFFQPQRQPHREHCLNNEDRAWREIIPAADKSLARPTSRCILFDGENISFDASLVIQVYINITNIPPFFRGSFRQNHVP
jgi:hypothetical protein